MSSKQSSSDQPSFPSYQLVMEWEPAEAANPDYFYDLKPGEVKRAAVWVRPKFPDAALAKMRVGEPLPAWLKISPISFVPPAKLYVEVDTTGIQVAAGDEHMDEFELEFFVDE